AFWQRAVSILGRLRLHVDAHTNDAKTYRDDCCQIGFLHFNALTPFVDPFDQLHCADPRPAVSRSAVPAQTKPVSCRGAPQIHISLTPTEGWSRQSKPSFVRVDSRAP